MPSSLMTDFEGFEFFAQLMNRTIEKRKYVLDFQDVTWIEANLCAILGAIITKNKGLGASFELENLGSSYLKATLRNNGFLKLIKGEKENNRKHSGIPFREFDMKDEDEVEKYIYDYVLLSQKVPKMSEGAKRKIFRSIFEIYQNSVMHSGAKSVFVCGQFYEKKKRMALTMVEIGHTFQYNVCNHSPEYSSYTGIEAIEWAVQSGNTTKPSTETGGLGLDLIRSFLQVNKGKLQIRSADGHWEEKKGVKLALPCKNHFGGSVVNIEFNLFDKNQYYTKDEIDIKSIL